MSKFGISGAGNDPLAYADRRLATVPTVDSPRDPTVNDRRYPIQTVWRNNSTRCEWLLTGFESGTGNALWEKFIGANGTVLTLSGDAATAVPPDADGDINLAGGAGVTVTEDASNNKLTIALSGGGQAIDTLETDDGAPSVVPDSNGNLIVAGGTGITTAGQGPGTTVTINLDSPVSVTNGGTGASSLTDGGILLGSGTSAVTVTSQPTDGQLLIGDTGTDPVLATLTEGPGIDIINGAGSITVSAITGGGPGYSNIGWSYSAGTFTIHGEDGTALSATNPAYVTLPDKDNANQFVTYEITANQSFIDDAGSSEIAGNNFGTTDTVAWNEDIGFFIYAVGNDAQDTIQFMLSRNPCAYRSPAAANIGAPDDSVADAQRDFWSLDNLDETLFDQNPCLAIGGIRMRKTTAGTNDWTVQALVAGKDGPGKFYEGIAWNFPTDQFGAINNAAGTWFLDRTDATYPVFDTESYTYMLHKDGWVDINVVLISCNTSGSGTNPLSFTVPLQATTESGEISMGQTQPIRGNFIDDSAGTSNLYTGYLGANTNTTSTTSVFLKEGSTTSLQPGSFVGSGSNDTFNFGHSYKAF